MKYIIDTPCGKIRGIKENKDGVIAFKGIRYANASRFEYPKQIMSWQGIYDATKYGHCSYQPRAFYDEEKNLKKVFYYNEFRKNQPYSYSEDCLFLNIWTTEIIKEKLPVLIYIHGGGYTGGCGHELHFDGPVWPTKGVIAVTINYRLGPLGFICLKQLQDEAGHTGNYGLFDQLTAIKWIKDNIESFGGDPDNISIMGQSAGAMSVQQLCLSPLSEGLFNKAIMSSGGGVSKLMTPKTPQKNFDFWNKVMINTGCTTLEEFKKVDVEKLFASWDKIKKQEKGSFMITSPVLDNILIVKKPKTKNIPFLIGSNQEDIIPPIIHSMAKKWSSNQKQNSYCYMFNHQLPGDKNGSWHSSDLWYWFGTLDNCWRPLTDVDYNLSNKMTSYLTNFVKTANPNDNDLPLWECASKQNKVMHFGNGKIEMQKVKKSKLWINLFTKKAVGE